MIKQLQSCDSFKKELRDTCRANRLSITLLNGLTIKRLRVIYSRTLQHYEADPVKAESNFFQNQLRLFHWSLVFESFQSKRLISQFHQTAEQWEHIQTCFPPKKVNIFEFQAKKLLGHSKDNYSRSWLPEECELLLNIMEDKTMMNQWNDVARRFYQESGKKFYRSSKQCREQWFNHLDVSKRHGGWTRSQDKSILEFVLQNGRKWAQFCKNHLPSRTEHMIKNRFKSLLSKVQPLSKKDQPNERKLIRRVLAHLQDKEETSRNDSQVQPRKNGDMTLIKKQGTVSTEKEIKSQECRQDSFLGQIVQNIPKNGCVQLQGKKQVISPLMEKQNKKSERREPLGPSALPLVQEPLVSPSFNFYLESGSMVHHQQYMSPPAVPSFPFLPIYPYCFLNQSFPTQADSFYEGHRS